MSLSRFFCLTTLAAVLCACGQTGPLYLPDQPSPRSASAMRKNAHSKSVTATSPTAPAATPDADAEPAPPASTMPPSQAAPVPPVSP